MTRLVLFTLALFTATSAFAEPPLGKGKDKEATFGPVKVLANGIVIGAFLQSDTLGNTRRTIQALSSTGYQFTVYANDPADPWISAGYLTTSSVWYETAGCSGQAYVGVINDLRSDLQASETQGVVFSVANSAGSAGHYYVPAGSIPASRSFVASDSGTGCTVNFDSNVSSVEALPNDPEITAVPNEPFAAPITLGY